MNIAYYKWDEMCSFICVLGDSRSNLGPEIWDVTSKTLFLPMKCCGVWESTVSWYLPPFLCTCQPPHAYQIGSLPMDTWDSYICDLPFPESLSNLSMPLSGRLHVVNCFLSGLLLGDQQTYHVKQDVVIVMSSHLHHWT